MSIYGPRLRLPKISLPISLAMPKLGLKTLLILLSLILLIATITFFVSTPIDFSQHITVYWNNNPLNLKENQATSAELKLIILNDSKETQNIMLEVNSESSELIIFCPDKSFPNVAQNHKRETTCIIRRNPNEKIFAGTYKINIITNLGKTSTTLEIRK